MSEGQVMQTEHPQIEQLSAFALGKLDAPALDAVESHLAQCLTCCETPSQIKEDTFVGLVRGARDVANGASDEAGHAATDADRLSQPIADAGRQVAAST